MRQCAAVTDSKPHPSSIIQANSAPIPTANTVQSQRPPGPVWRSPKIRVDHTGPGGLHGEAEEELLAEA